MTCFFQGSWPTCKQDPGPACQAVGLTQVAGGRSLGQFTPREPAQPGISGNAAAVFSPEEPILAPYTPPPPPPGKSCVSTRPGPPSRTLGALLLQTPGFPRGLACEQPPGSRRLLAGP